MTSIVPYICAFDLMVLPNASNLNAGSMCTPIYSINILLNCLVKKFCTYLAYRRLMDNYASSCHTVMHVDFYYTVIHLHLTCKEFHPAFENITPDGV